MKLLFKLAFKNILGMALRTWLNVLVLSFSFITIIFYNGMIDGWNGQARKDSIAWEYGQGQLWHEVYDPFDPFTLVDAHGTLSNQDGITPILIRQATIYPQGRMMPVLLKGIPIGQKTLKVPIDSVAGKVNGGVIPITMGERMAKSSKVKQGEQFLMRWRDKQGTFDAQQVQVAHIFKTDVPTVDQGQIWLPLEILQQMTGLTHEATIGIVSKPNPPVPKGWVYKSEKELLAELDFIIQSKKASGSILYLILLGIALLAIFDTQVFSVFRRQREIGTYIALGMTRWQVVGLFTVEGTANSILASLLGALYGIPLLTWVAKIGIGMPAAADQTGIAMGEKIYPTYSLALILGTLVLVVGASAIVSFFPARRIAQINPVDALKGKMG